MQNFSTATEATAAALNSSGSAARENARYMESIEARVTAVSAAFQKMSMAVVDSDLVKGILDVVKGLADFGATDVGSTVTQILLLSGASWGGLQLLGQSILPGIMSSFGASEGIILGFKAALSGSLPVILAVVGGITALVAIIKAVKSAYDAANPSVEEASLQMKNAEEALKQTEDNYANAKQKLDELNATHFEDRTSEIQNEIDKLDSLVNYYSAVQKAKQGEVVASAASYVKAVEKEGFSSGWEVTMPYFTGEIDDQGVRVIDEYTEVFGDYESAVYAAAAVSAQFNDRIVSVEDVEKAGKKLKNLGVTFTELKIGTEDVTQGLSDFIGVLESGTKLTPSVIDDYTNLKNYSSQYAESLKIMQENGIALSDSQKEFLEVFDLFTQAYEKRMELEAEAQGVTKEDIASRYEAAAALSTYAQNLLAAASAYDTFKNRLAETGDYDDGFKGLTAVFGELNSEWEKGQVGSQAFLTALELLTGQSFTSAEAVDYMNNNLDTLNLLFGDSESGGMGLITALEDLGYATLDADGNLQVSIDDFGALADQLGISESSLYAVTEALRVMGIDFQYNSEDILNNIAKLGDGIVDFGETTTVNFEEYVRAAKEAGRSNEEIIAIGEVLANTANVDLTNLAEGMAVLGGNSDEAGESASDAASNYEEIGGTSGGIESASSAMSDLAGNTAAAANSAASLSGSLSSISNFKAPSLGALLFGGFAEGTSHAKEGDALVNEEGAELIQSGDKAYIAGGGLPTIAHLHEGDKVYTAEETKDILKGGKLPNPIQAHVKGTLTGGGGTSGSKKVTGTGVGGGTASITAAILAGLKGKGRTGNSGSSSSSSSSSSTSSSDSSKDIKDEFDEWLKAKKHALAMDQITEEEYYKALGEMNDKYFKGKKEYQDEYWKYQEQIYSWEKKQEEERAKAAAKAYEDEFKTWLDAQDHALAMDEITQEEYYTALEQMNDKYFKDREEYQDEYWRYEEKIYAWRKRQAEEEARAQEQALKDQIDLEKKLNDLAKAQASKVKVFENGQFRYISDREALAKAQEALSSYGNGTLSASGGLSLVGENGAEMRVLNKGDGIIPANITKNLWNWGSIDPSVFASKSSDNSIYNFDISNLDLPNVHNATDFVSGLKSFALQYIAQRG